MENVSLFLRSFDSASPAAASVMAGSLLVSVRLARRPQFYCGTNVVHLLKIRTVCNNSSLTSGHKGAQAVLMAPGLFFRKPLRKDSKIYMYINKYNSHSAYLYMYQQHVMVVLLHNICPSSICEHEVYNEITHMVLIKSDVVVVCVVFCFVFSDSDGFPVLNV